MVVPAVFADDDDGYGVVRLTEAELTPEIVEQAALAAANCPERAITVER
jgi:ferredoxin